MKQYMGKKKGRTFKCGISKDKTFMGGVINPKGKFDLRAPYKRIAKKGNNGEGI